MQHFRKCSIQFSCSVVSSYLWPHGLHHARPPCPSPTPITYSTLYPLSWWCHPTISSSVVPISSCFPSFPASRTFPLVTSSNLETKVLEFQLQHQFFWKSQFLGRLIRESMVLKEEKGIWNSQGGGKGKHLFFFPPSTFLSLTHIKCFFTLSREMMITEQTIQFKICTKDYIATMYPA